MNRESASRSVDASQLRPTVNVLAKMVEELVDVARLDRRSFRYLSIESHLRHLRRLAGLDDEQ